MHHKIWKMHSIQLFCYDLFMFPLFGMVEQFNLNQNRADKDLTKGRVVPESRTTTARKADFVENAVFDGRIRNKKIYFENWNQFYRSFIEICFDICSGIILQGLMVDATNLRSIGLRTTRATACFLFIHVDQISEVKSQWFLDGQGQTTTTACPDRGLPIPV